MGLWNVTLTGENALATLYVNDNFWRALSKLTMGSFISIVEVSILEIFSLANRQVSKHEKLLKNS